jgi:hypothetical protein|uniref:Uncharacterized protein n=1 Tax=viral metagenome TaxID=1070528 RepID=A0A6C0BYR8_9ZZZZ
MGEKENEQTKNTELIGTEKDVINLLNNIEKNKFDIKQYQIYSDEKQQDWLQHQYNLESQYNFYNHWTKNNKYGWFKFTYSIKKVNILRRQYELNNNIKQILIARLIILIFYNNIYA